MDLNHNNDQFQSIKENRNNQNNLTNIKHFNTDNKYFLSHETKTDPNNYSIIVKTPNQNSTVVNITSKPGTAQMEQVTDESSLFYPQDDLQLRMSTRLARLEIDQPWRTQEMKEIDATMYVSQPGPKHCPMNDQEIQSNPYYVNPAMVSSFYIPIILAPF